MTGSRNVFASTALGLLVAVACAMPAADAQVTGYKQGGASGKVTGAAGTRRRHRRLGRREVRQADGRGRGGRAAGLVMSALRGYGLGNRRSA